MRASLSFGDGHPPGEPLDPAALSPAEWQGPLFELLRAPAARLSGAVASVAANAAASFAEKVPAMRGKVLAN